MPAANAPTCPHSSILAERVEAETLTKRSGSFALQHLSRGVISTERLL